MAELEDAAGSDDDGFIWNDSYWDQFFSVLDTPKLT